MVQTFHPEAVFLDSGLPGINGNELAQRLRQLAGLEKAPLVALTGYGQEEGSSRPVRSGGEDTQGSGAGRRPAHAVG
jgi:two-component system CheB/CheR fusion protein